MALTKWHVLNHVTSQHFWSKYHDYPTYKEIIDILALIRLIQNVNTKESHKQNINVFVVNFLCLICFLTHQSAFISVWKGDLSLLYMRIDLLIFTHFNLMKLHLYCNRVIESVSSHFLVSFTYHFWENSTIYILTTLFDAENWNFDCVFFVRTKSFTF